jgi:hypothetical protein
MLSKSCLIESMKFINGAYRSMAPVVKETLYVVLNFDGVQTSNVYEQFLNCPQNFSYGSLKSRSVFYKYMRARAHGIRTSKVQPGAMVSNFHAQ